MSHPRNYGPGPQFRELQRDIDARTFVAEFIHGVLMEQYLRAFSPFMQIFNNPQTRPIFLNKLRAEARQQGGPMASWDDSRLVDMFFTYRFSPDMRDLAARLNDLLNNHSKFKQTPEALLIEDLVKNEAKNITELVLEVLQSHKFCIPPEYVHSLIASRLVSGEVKTYTPEMLKKQLASLKQDTSEDGVRGPNITGRSRL